MYGLDVAVRGVSLAAGQPHFTIIGDGPERQRLAELARAVGSGRVRLESPITQQALAARLPRYHAGIVPTRLDGMTRYSLSTKLLEYVHLEIPVLAARLPSYERYFSEDMLWYWIPGDPADLARVIHAFSSASPSERASHARRARQAIAPLAWSQQRDRLLAAYAELLTGDGSDKIAAMRSAAVPSP
jgi:glycosyltransferase involved in cell wall biosynthesis